MSSLETGWFVIDDITYTSGSLTAVDARFEQHCEGATPALHGQIHWVSGDTTVAVAPSAPRIGAGTLSPAGSVKVLRGH